jgi:DNA-binding SARP family transcriptional activator
MQCYSRLGQGPLALRQYQICVEALQAELQVDPAPETTRLYEQIHRREQI